MFPVSYHTQFLLTLFTEFTDWDDQMGYAEYNGFRINDKSDNFRLILGEYMGGNAGDSMTYHNNTQFSTRVSWLDMEMKLRKIRNTTK